jgi:hypothetical protein
MQPVAVFGPLFWFIYSFGRWIGNGLDWPARCLVWPLVGLALLDWRDSWSAIWLAGRQDGWKGPDWKNIMSSFLLPADLLRTYMLYSAYRYAPYPLLVPAILMPKERLAVFMPSALFLLANHCFENVSIAPCFDA